MGAALLKYVINSNNLTYTDWDYNSQAEWDIPLGGDYSDLPLHKDINNEENETTTAEVQCQINNDYASGDHDIEYMPKYTFGYYGSSEGICSDCSSYYLNYKTVAPTSPLVATYTAVQN